MSNEAGKKIPEHIIDNCINKNQDGFAIYLMKEKRLIKTLDKDVFRVHMEKETPFVAHCRFKTKGKVCEENIHLFQEGSWLFAMNGTVNGFRDSDANDTRELIKLIKYIPDPKNQIRFLRAWAARFLVIDRNTNQIVRTGQWLEKDGVYYSKDNVLEEPKKNYQHQHSGSRSHSQSSHQSSQRTNNSNKSSFLKDYDDDLNDVDTNAINCDEWIEINGVMTMVGPISAKYKKDNDELKKKLFDQTEEKERQSLQKAAEKKEEASTTKSREDLRDFRLMSETGSSSTSVIIGVYGHLRVAEPAKVIKILRNSKYIATTQTSMSYGMVLSDSWKPYLIDRIRPHGSTVELELFKITLDEMKELDVIMRYPHVFNRKKIAVQDIEGNKYKPFVYVISNESTIEKLDNKHYFNKFTLEQEEKCLNLNT